MVEQFQSQVGQEFQSRLVEWANRLCQTMGFKVECDAAVAGGMLFLNFSGPDAGDLLANHGEVLQAVEYLLNKIFQADVNQFGMINCDVSGKKQVRMEELRLIARAAAERVRETKIPYKLNPMDSRERRIIHLTLAGDTTIRTASEGEGEFRKVVIHLAEG